MNPLKAVMQQAVAGMGRESSRITVAAENISNVDTPGYQKKLLSMQPQIGGADAFAAMKETLDETPGERNYQPSHEANRTYEANLNAFQQARSMYSSLLDILRR